MKNADMPAMPVHDVIETYSADDNEGPFLLTREYTGLTKREMFAMAAMQGILSNNSITDARGQDRLDWIKNKSYSMADAMLAEPDK